MISAGDFAHPAPRLAGTWVCETGRATHRSCGRRAAPVIRRIPGAAGHCAAWTDRYAWRQNNFSYPLPEGNVMLGLMQDWSLLCHRVIDHAATNHGHREVVSRSVEGP